MRAPSISHVVVDPTLDNKTDKLVLTNLKTELEEYLEKRQKEKTRDLTQTNGLTLVKNRIYHACSTLSEREAAIQRILSATNSRQLEREIKMCWRVNSWDDGRPKGELAIIISTHWNRLNRMTLAEKQLLDTELSQTKNQQKLIEGVILSSKKEASLDEPIDGVVIDSVPQLKVDLENALIRRGNTSLRLLGNVATTEQRVLQSALQYIDSEKREGDIDALVSVLQASKTHTQSKTEKEIVHLVRRLIILHSELNSACSREQQNRQGVSSDSQGNDAQGERQAVEMLAALRVPQQLIVMPGVATGVVVDDQKKNKPVTKVPA